MKKIKGIFFDYDNTLGNRYLYSYLTMQDFVREFMPQLEEGSMEFEIAVQDLVIHDEFGYTHGHHVLPLLEEEDGFTYNYPEEGFSTWWRKNLWKHSCLFPDTLETLEQLIEQGYILGVITNGSSDAQWNKLRQAGIQDCFDTIVVSGDHPFRKPDKEIYEYACQQVSLKPEECIYVGDNLHLDIYGAYKAGLTPVWMWPDRVKPENLGVYRIEKLSELFAVLEELNK